MSTSIARMLRGDQTDRNIQKEINKKRETKKVRNCDLLFCVLLRQIATREERERDTITGEDTQTHTYIELIY